MSLSVIAALLNRLVPDHPKLAKCLALLAAKVPEESETDFDGRAALHRSHANALRAAFERFHDTDRDLLFDLIDGTSELPKLPTPATGGDAIADRCSLVLLQVLGNQNAQGAIQLAVVLARLLEDARRLTSRGQRIGLGFEDRLAQRWQRRLRLLPDRLALLESFCRHRMLILQHPQEGQFAIERDKGDFLSDDEKKWLATERLAATFFFVRSQQKTEGGHIRWFVRSEGQFEYVLDRLDAPGHWLVSGPARTNQLALVGHAFARRPESTRGSDDAGAWHTLRLAGPAEEPSIPVVWEAGRSQAEVLETLESASHTVPSRKADTDHRPEQLITALAPARQFVIVASSDALMLRAVYNEAHSETIASVSAQAGDHALINFLETIERLSETAVPRLEIEPAAASTSVRHAVESLLITIQERHQTGTDAPVKSRVRLVYIPSSIPHPLGGVPMIGTAFLSDRLQRLGYTCDTINLPAYAFDQRLPELLGADVVGIGVYVHNRDEVACLVKKLRRAGYGGHIVLGGPQTRAIDSVLRVIDDWDAIVRGEAEDVLPEVLETLRAFRQGQLARGLQIATRLQGVILRHQGHVLVCNTSGRNRVREIICPLPFAWFRFSSDRRLKMNFARGCPYRCVFCPNHQGTKIQTGSAEHLWHYTILAIADDLPMPVSLADDLCQRIAGELQVPMPLSLPVSLHLLLRKRPSWEEYRRSLIAPLQQASDPRVWSSPDLVEELIGIPIDFARELSESTEFEPRFTTWHAKERWLLAKVALLATLRLWESEGSHPEEVTSWQKGRQPPFVIETSEDNTLVNKREIRKYLERRRTLGFSGLFRFNPGQNAVRDLLVAGKEVDHDYLDILSWENPFDVALGSDGTSDTILQQNNKPNGKVTDILRVNRALAAKGIEVVNNYILLAPETRLLEAIESFVLFLLLPVRWRNYGDAVNLRVIKEETTIATDEGILFNPADEDYYVPFRSRPLQDLLDRWELTSMVPSEQVPKILWRMLKEDTQVSTLLPRLANQWRFECPRDAEISALGQLLFRARGVSNSWYEALVQTRADIDHYAFHEGRCTGTFQDVLLHAVERDRPLFE